MNISQLPKEEINEVIDNAKFVSQLNEYKKELLSYGYSNESLTIAKIERRIMILEGKDPGPEVKPSGADLPPITGTLDVTRLVK